MRVIYTSEDVRRLRGIAGVPPALAEAIAAAFLGLFEMVCDGLFEPGAEGEALEAFTLERCGPIAVLEPGDGPGAWACLGLPGGLEQNRPEWANRQDYDGRAYYNALVLLNNEVCVSLFIPPGVVDATDQAILDDEAGVVAEGVPA
jgi:hypothetical protein